MELPDLSREIEHILDQVFELKTKYISESLGTVDYVGIASNDQEFLSQVIELVKKIGGAVVYSDDWGNVYRFKEEIQTKYGRLDLIKICHPDGRKHKSYADFQTDKYVELNKKYAKRKNFVNLYGPGWEILGIQDPSSPVSLYIPNIPLSADLRKLGK